MGPRRCERPEPQHTAGAERIICRLADAESATKQRGNLTPAERGLIEALQRRYVREADGTIRVDDAAYARDLASLAASTKASVVLCLAADAALTAFSRARTDQLAGVPPLRDLEASLVRQAAAEPSNAAVLHFLIHVAEMNGTPLQAQAAAERLRSLAMGDDAGHLVHMASHVFVHTGDFVKVRDDNRRAVAMDERFAAATSTSPTALDYYQHELEFWYGASTALGDEKSRMIAAEALRKAAPYTEIIRDVQAENYAAAVKVADAYGESSVVNYGPVRLKFFAGIAYTKAGRLSSARAVSRALDAEQARSKSQSTLVHALVLRAELANKSGATADAEALFREATGLVDHLSFESVPRWFLDVRQYWAAMDLEHNNATAAIALLKDDVAQFPRNVPGLRLLRAAYGAANDAQSAARTDAEIAAVQRAL